MIGACRRMLEEDAEVRARTDRDCFAALTAALEAATKRLTALEASVRATASERACGGACLDGLKPNQACTETCDAARVAVVVVASTGCPPAAAGVDPNPDRKGSAGRCGVPGWATAGPPLSVDAVADGVVYVGLNSPTGTDPAAASADAPGAKPGPASPGASAAGAGAASGVERGGVGGGKGAHAAARTVRGAHAKQGCGCVVS